MGTEVDGADGWDESSHGTVDNTVAIPFEGSCKNQSLQGSCTCLPRPSQYPCDYHSLATWLEVILGWFQVDPRVLPALTND